MHERDLSLLFLHKPKLGHGATKTSTNVNAAWSDGTTSDNMDMKVYRIVHILQISH